MSGGTIGGYDFGQILDNVAKLSPQAGDLLVISGERPDDETVVRIGRELASGNVGVRVILTAEGDEVYLLHPEPGDLLLVRGDLDEEAFGRFVADVQEIHPDLHVRRIPDGVLLEIADEAMMRALGWVRAPVG